MPWVAVVGSDAVPIVPRVGVVGSEVVPTVARAGAVGSDAVPTVPRAGRTLDELGVWVGNLAFGIGNRDSPSIFFRRFDNGVPRLG